MHYAERERILENSIKYDIRTRIYNLCFRFTFFFLMYCFVFIIGVEKKQELR